jgi:uncharacterized membrane protein
MAGSFCPYCGKPTVPGATFCPSCGAALGRLSTAGAAPPPAIPPSFGPTGSYPIGYGTTAAPSSASRDTDRRALTSVQWAAVVALVGVVISWVSLFGSNLGSFFMVTTVNSSTSVSLSLTALYFFVAVAGAGLVLTIVELLFYRSAFRTLAPIDSRFSSPATFVLVLLIAVVLIVLIGAGLLLAIYQAVQCAGSGNPLTTSCVDTGTLLGLVALFAVAGIVALIGYIGLMLGIWRLGTRYDETTFKVGAILIIIPLLNLIGVILILVGARSALGKLGHGSTPISFG